MLWVILLFASVSLYGRSLLTHLMTRLSSYVASVELFQNCLSVASFELFHTKTALFPSGHNSLVAFVSVATHYILNVVWQQFPSVTALPTVGRPWLMAVCVSKLCVCLQSLLGFRTNKETYWSNGVWKGVVCGGTICDDTTMLIIYRLLVLTVWHPIKSYYWKPTSGDPHQSVGPGHEPNSEVGQ